MYRRIKKTGNRSKIFLVTKFGFVAEPRAINGEPEYVKAACAKSLGKLGVDQIDLFYAHVSTFARLGRTYIYLK
jgi:aryl-alcohol dehydrogenase-like predicted oxidoreductase